MKVQIPLFGDATSLTDNGEDSVAQKINIILNDMSLKTVNSTKFLSLIIDEIITRKTVYLEIYQTISRNHWNAQHTKTLYTW